MHFLLLLLAAALIHIAQGSSNDPSLLKSELVWSIDNKPQHPFESYPSNLFVHGPVPESTIPKIKFNGNLNDVFTDICATVYAVGKFDSILYNVTNATTSYYLTNRGYTKFSVPMPLFVYNPQLLRGMSQLNSASSYLFHGVANFDGEISSVNVECGSLKLDTVDYCSAECDIYIAGPFSFQYKGNTITNVARFKTSAMSWQPIFDKDSNTGPITFISKTNFGLFVATRNSLLYGANYAGTTSLLSFITLTTFNEQNSKIYRMIPYRSKLYGNKLIFIGDFVSKHCSYFCQFDPVSGDLAGSEFVSTPVWDIAIDFHKENDTDIYLLQDSFVKRWRNGDWLECLSSSVQLSNIGLCYENSLICKQQGKYFVTDMNGQVTFYNDDTTPNMTRMVPHYSDQEQLITYSLRDAFVAQNIFNTPNSGLFLPNTIVNVFADSMFPKQTDYSCQFYDEASTAQLVAKNTLQCIVPNVTITYPRNIMFLQVTQRVPSAFGTAAYATYQRRFLYYGMTFFNNFYFLPDGNDLCEAKRFDLRYKMSRFMGVAILTITICFIVSLIGLVFISILLLLPCKFGKTTSLLESLITQLETPQFETGADSQVREKPKSILGGWVTFLLVFLFCIGATYMIVESVDPFQVVSDSGEDTFGKVPLAFKMQWNVTKTNCNYDACQEYIVGTQRSVTVTNYSELATSNTRKYLVDISTELYASEADYAIKTDQCCNYYEVSPIPQMRLDDPTQQGLNFVPAFSMFSDYQKVAELAISDIRYVFKSYSDKRNVTSNIVFNNLWNNLKLEQKDSFFGLIEDALLVKRQPMCLIHHCDLSKTTASGTRYNLVVPGQCFELASGASNYTQMHFTLQRRSSQTIYSGNPTAASVTLKVVTLVGSVLGLRPVLTTVITGVHEKILTKFTHIKSVFVFLFLLIIQIPGLAIAVMSWFPQINMIRSVFFEYGFDTSFVETGGYIGLVTSLEVALKFATAFTLNFMLVWNAGFFSSWKHIQPFSLSFWGSAFTEPWKKLSYGWRMSIPFRIITILWLINFIPIIEFVLFFVIWIMWKRNISAWFAEEFDITPINAIDDEETQALYQQSS